MDQHTPTDSDALLRLLQQVSENYQEPPPAPPKRGKQRDFSGLSFLLLAVVAVVTRTFRDCSTLYGVVLSDGTLCDSGACPIESKQDDLNSNRPNPSNSLADAGVARNHGYLDNRHCPNGDIHLWQLVEDS